MIDSFSNEFGLKHENVLAVFRAIATALCWDVKAFENIASRMNDIHKKALMVETLSILSFDADTVDATGIFIKAFKTISNAKLLFAPNRINTSKVRLKNFANALRQLSFWVWWELYYLESSKV